MGRVAATPSFLLRRDSMGPQVLGQRQQQSSVQHEEKHKITTTTTTNSMLRSYLEVDAVEEQKGTSLLPLMLPMG